MLLQHRLCRDALLAVWPARAGGWGLGAGGRRGAGRGGAARTKWRPGPFGGSHTGRRHAPLLILVVLQLFAAGAEGADELCSKAGRALEWESHVGIVLYK